MMMTNNVESYQNLIELLKKALEFYASDETYKYIHDDIRTSLIVVDKGSQARFALSKITEFEKINQDILDEYNKYADNYLNDVDSDSENTDVENIINSIKSIGNGENSNI